MIKANHDKNLTGQATLDRLAVGEPDVFVGNMNRAAEETVVFLTGNFQHFRAYRVDSNTTRHINCRTEHKTIEI